MNISCEKCQELQACLLLKTRTIEGLSAQLAEALSTVAALKQENDVFRRGAPCLREKLAYSKTPRNLSNKLRKEIEKFEKILLIKNALIHNK